MGPLGWVPRGDPTPVRLLTLAGSTWGDCDWFVQKRKASVWANGSRVAMELGGLGMGGSDGPGDSTFPGEGVMFGR